MEVGVFRYGKSYVVATTNLEYNHKLKKHALDISLYDNKVYLKAILYYRRKFK